MDKKKHINGWKRHGMQALWALLTNSYLIGFAQGKIYRGKLKNLCVPGLNCYSCPGALGSCPIGAMQAVIGSWFFGVFWRVDGAFCLWLALPFWAYPGASPQNSISQESPGGSWGQAAAQTEIPDIIGICDTSAHVPGGCHWPGGAIFLQAALPGRHFGRRNPAGTAEPLHAGCHWLALCLEEPIAGSHGYFIYPGLPPILQIHMPVGCSLFRI